LEGKHAWWRWLPHYGPRLYKGSLCGRTRWNEGVTGSLARGTIISVINLNLNEKLRW